MKTAIGSLVLLSLASLAYAQRWEIPRGAPAEKSPLSPSAAVLKRGKAHGPDKTNDLAHPAADLTRGFRAQMNPDGVLFYKIWNGRIQPTMPAYKDTLSRDEVWAIVEYIKTLRKP
jgi:mono/diheme cytochrome c family protein